MCAVNQDAKEAVKQTVETDGLIGALGEIDSHQVRIGAIFLNLFFTLPFHVVLQ